MRKTDNFTWSKNWIWKYQSIWCTIERFKYANSLTNTDIKKILYTKDKRKPIQLNSSVYICNRTINLKRYSEIFDEDLFNRNSNELKSYLYNVFNIPDIEKIIIRNFRYCPVCIKQGYHSILHQLAIFQTCPFHGIELTTKCPKCNKEKSYIIDFNQSQKCFECSCGYCYINNDFLYNFINWRNDNFKLLPQSTFKDNKKNYYIFPSFSWYIDNNFSLNIFNCSCNRFREILFNNNFKNTQNINFIISLQGSIVPNYNDVIYDESRFLMMNEYISIIKSVARQIRKKNIKKNVISFYKKNLPYLYFDYYQDKISKEGLCYKDIDADVYAYIMWRKVVEGHEYINTIHSKLTNRASDDPQFTLKRNITESVFYKYMLDEFNLYFKAYNHNEYVSIYDYGLLVDSFQRILCILFISYYKNCLEFATIKKSLYSNQIINFQDSISFPKIDFVIKFNNLNEATLIYYNVKN